MIRRPPRSTRTDTLVPYTTRFRSPAGRDEAPVQAGASHVDLSSLPAAGAIHWGNPKGERLVVFSDFQCGYCQRLAGALGKAQVHVEERPISIFGAASRKISAAVLCASSEERGAGTRCVSTLCSRGGP